MVNVELDAPNRANDQVDVLSVVSGSVNEVKNE
jgi:hypothetical protein